MYVCTCSVMSDSLGPHELQPAMLLCPWNFLGKTTAVCCHFLLQGIKPMSPALQVDSLPLSHLGSPFILIKLKTYTYLLPRFPKPPKSIASYFLQQISFLDILNFIRQLRRLKTCDCPFSLEARHILKSKYPILLL